MFDSADSRGGCVIILGIDPGLANTGWGVVESAGNSFRCVGYGCITTDAATGLANRLQAVHDGLTALIAAHRPSACAIESVYFSTNVRTAFATGQARGAALVAAASAGLDVGEYGPGEVKLAVTGNGTADKRQIAYMMRVILGLAEEPRPDHAADALALAVCHANNSGQAVAERDDGCAAACDIAGERGARLACAEATPGWAAAVARAERREAGGRR